MGTNVIVGVFSVALGRAEHPQFKLTNVRFIEVFGARPIGS